MAKYRKKPVVIESFQLKELDGFHVKQALEFIGQEVDIVHPIASDKFDDFVNIVNGSGGIVIKTLEGKMLASKGDYIIKGVNGEFYPCKPDIFEKTYDKVEE